MSENQKQSTFLKTRPLNFKKDFEDLLIFTKLAFAEELDTFGGDLREKLEELKKIYPMIRFLSIFNKHFKHFMDGYVVENDQHEWIATVLTSDNITCWDISNVATHPDYRRQGIAKQLVRKAIEHAKKLNAERLSLEVLENNTPAYNLYASLEFVPFDLQASLECKPDDFILPYHNEFPENIIRVPFSSKYPVKLQQYALRQKSISSEVQEYIPLKKPKRFSNFLLRILNGIAVKLVKLQKIGWLFYSKEKPEVLLGFVQINFAKSAKGVHNVRLLVDPEYQDALYPPLMSLMLETLEKEQRFQVPINLELRSRNRKFIDLLKTAQFKELERYQVMGRKTKV